MDVDFINYMNTVKKVKHFTLIDAVYFYYTTQQHYYQSIPPLGYHDFPRQGYREISYQNYTVASHNNRSEFLPITPQNSSGNVPKNVEIWNKNEFGNGGNSGNNANNYDIWKNTHTASIPIPPPKNKKYIDATIQSLDDILKIINENEYDEAFEYNINLKALTAIRTEVEELNNMVGMSVFKQSIINQILYFIQDLHKDNSSQCGGRGDGGDFKHTVIYGPPGTGKTEVAKILGKMYSKIGILKNNTFRKTTRSDFIAGYLGQTALKTRALIEDCLGGVLFIDEAYSLGNIHNNDCFSNECIDVLCEALSDHKNDLMVIIAGYENELNTQFFTMNSGLSSRFIWRFHIDNYTTGELLLILKKKVEENGWNFAENPSFKWLEDKKETFPNFGRDMELLFFYIKISHGRRIYGKEAEIRKMITLDDLDNGYKMFVANSKNKEKPVLYGLYV
jgi:hypothetical protein